MSEKTVKKINVFPVPIAFLALGLQAMLVGCGASPQQKEHTFFTSGNPEADQRADQRMAKSEQLKDAKADKAAAPKDANKTLFDRLGGDAGITLLVEDFVPRALADPRVNWTRKDVKQGGFSFHRGRSVTWAATPENILSMKKHLAQFIAVATGGPAKYDGREMKEAHSGLHITNDEFDASVGDLKATLDKLAVAVKEQKELLSIIETTRPQIVEER